MNKNDLIFAVAPNGAYKTKQNHPELPITQDEIITLSVNAQKLGVNMLHLHIRDNQGNHSIDSNEYLSLLDRLNATLNQSMVLQVTSESANIFSVTEQMDMIYKVKPHFVSIALREIMRAKKDEVKFFFSWMQKNNVNPQLIIYNEKDAKMYLENLSSGNLIGKKFPLLFVFGREIIEREKCRTAFTLITNLAQSKAKSWMVCGFQKLEDIVTEMSLKAGGNLRIGFENNLYSSNGELAKNNEDRISEVKKMIQTNERVIAKYDQVVYLLEPDW